MPIPAETPACDLEKPVAGEMTWCAAARKQWARSLELCTEIEAFYRAYYAAEGTKKPSPKRVVITVDDEHFMTCDE